MKGGEGDVARITGNQIGFLNSTQLERVLSNQMENKSQNSWVHTVDAKNPA